MTHAELVEAARRWLAGTKHCRVVATELVCADMAEVPDAIGWTYSTGSILVECKVSRSDFLADRKKMVRRSGLGVGEYRWYLTPRGLLTAADVDVPWGLAEVRGSRVYVVQHASHITLEPYGWRRERGMLQSIAWRYAEASRLLKPVTAYEEYPAADTATEEYPADV